MPSHSGKEIDGIPSFLPPMVVCDMGVSKFAIYRYKAMEISDTKLLNWLRLHNLKSLFDMLIQVKLTNKVPATCQPFFGLLRIIMSTVQLATAN